MLNRIFLEITKECNLRCQLCKLWQQKDPNQKLTTKQKIHFLSEIILWLDDNNEVSNKDLSVILTGGEPFQYIDHVLEISNFCQLNEIKSYVNTNGSLLEPYIIKILKSGLTALTISIDSHKPEIHDDLRGFLGLFNHLIKILRRMKSKKDENGYPIKLCVQSILGGWNINTLPAHINFFLQNNIHLGTF